MAIRFSEIKRDVLLACDWKDEESCELLTKQELTARMEETGEKPETVYTAECIRADFTFSDIESMVRDEAENKGMYDDWEDDVIGDIEGSDEVQAFLDYMNGKAEKYRSYEQGEEVLMEG